MNKLGIALLVGMTAVASLGVDGIPPPLPGGFTVDGRGFEGVIGGPHDFSHFGGSACDACHVPHVQAIRPVATPTTQPATQPAVELFRIPGQAPVFVPGQFTPGPTSLLCLGCHDGTIGTSTLGSAHAMLAGVREGFGVPDELLWRDHPIGIPYPVDPNNYRPASFVEKQGIRLPQGRVECISCHDPHNQAGVRGMLWMPNRRSALCLTCHLK
ncbi:MAG TPA: cytochrome c3 family protein [Phycisphaerae bacterium]|nr:cytochrome c3 family protein [Phycisphaerae bacterium]HOJ75071.1 cytochrome c3 family protein [Phycisphaerae bacterium]HOM51942.1 cytochrome c3 family protein [Phycisphaerae bacterium]HON66241.1 cytochrome c3 family protein [Phycisphaerae bacterium]HOQ85022.1 cytochrome c3 family protein [Phycisphaerae bacterium]